MIGVDVANNSYSVDSALTRGATSSCRSDDAQRTVIKAVSRAVEYAERRNVTMIASAGNNGLDMADPAFDRCQPAAERAARRPDGLVHRDAAASTSRPGLPRTTASATST